METMFVEDMLLFVQRIKKNPWNSDTETTYILINTSILD